MNSNQLWQFQTIAECGSITKAAEMLFITQPALSTSLTKLEDEISRPLFVRDGKSLKLTEDGEVLLHYARIVTDAIHCAEEYFRTRNDVQFVNLYRIGGIAVNLLMEECFHIKNHRLNCMLVQNKELMRISASGIADIIIADDRYMTKVVHNYTEREVLYHQQLILSVRKEDPLAQYDEINVKDLQRIPMLGHVNPLGFESWISEIKRDNCCSFIYEFALDNMTYFAERDKILLPVFMGSFGIGTEQGRDYFAQRKSIKVNGIYTERDICLWYNKKNKKSLELVIEKIKENAEKVLNLDSKSGYL